MLSEASTKRIDILVSFPICIFVIFFFQKNTEIRKVTKPHFLHNHNHNQFQSEHSVRQSFQVSLTTPTCTTSNPSLISIQIKNAVFPLIIHNHTYCNRNTKPTPLLRLEKDYFSICLSLIQKKKATTTTSKKTLGVLQFAFH